MKINHFRANKIKMGTTFARTIADCRTNRKKPNLDSKEQNNPMYA